MITDPFFYLCAIPAVLLFGMAKGGFGGTVAVVSVPLMALAVPPLQAAAILLPILVVMDAVALWSFRGQYDRVNLRILLPAAVAGVVVGAFFFRYLSDDAIRILIGLIAVVFCLNYWLSPGYRSKTEPNWVKGSFWGMMAGFTSFGIHAGAPPVSVYMLPQQLEKKLLMGTFAVFFAAVNFVKLFPYAWLGSFDSANLLTSLVLIPLAPIGVRLGFYLLHKVKEQTIYRLAYFFLCVMGVKLLHEGVLGLIAAQPLGAI
ncbi:sulfite exporter TauE/SafE family protein [Aestuariirhabdus litorea]|uniref:Probable membrane transporter protein n=1 Tax=Aestuariirhabdus litorea TaxID=2528527 RepID=A0A3P3VPR1_9GAMM|nr:sulfite exporter TauE/SafE family protein [Aestuariirhabdus litorea]RRJ84424.1 sulfite exporter TauE/SafE family protein [Aestuariirhabdus litorea]RWW97648.1 sulfite exporter TauE/SafE family protein [Endozoicomonadaceae bacterium GTF-13]